MKTIKFLIVGDGNVGKTSLLLKHTLNHFPKDYFSTVIDTFRIYSHHKKDYLLELREAADPYEHLNLYSYCDIDVFFICFSIGHPISYLNVEHKWIPKIRTRHCKEALVVLVGTKKDLRYDETTIVRLSNTGPVKYKDGLELAKRIQAYAYVECSALKGIGLSKVFESGALAFIERKRRSRSKCCLCL